MYNKLNELLEALKGFSENQTPEMMVKFPHLIGLPQSTMQPYNEKLIVQFNGFAIHFLPDGWWLEDTSGG